MFAVKGAVYAPAQRKLRPVESLTASIVFAFISSFRSSNNMKFTHSLFHDIVYESALVPRHTKKASLMSTLLCPNRSKA